MTASYLLLEPQPGRSGDVHDALSSMPEVQATQELFGNHLAARLELDDLEAAAEDLEALDSVAWACLYGNDDSGALRRPLTASG